MIPTGKMLIILGLTTPKLLTLPAFYALFERSVIPTEKMLIMSIMSRLSYQKMCSEPGIVSNVNNVNIFGERGRPPRNIDIIDIINITSVLSVFY